MVRYYQPSVIVELGTSLVSALRIWQRVILPPGVYAGRSALDCIHRFTTIQGYGHRECTTGRRRVRRCITGNPCMKFRRLILLSSTGNHQYGPTLDYFSKLRARSHQRTIMVFDDIHWSRGMEDAWNRIKDDPAVTLSIDLFLLASYSISRFWSNSISRYDFNFP